MSVRWSNDAAVAERQMQAVIFCLVSFGYIDTEFDKREKSFIVQHIQELVEDRASGIADDTVRADVVRKWSKHYQEVMDEMDRDILCHFTESVCEGESTHQFVLAKLESHGLHPAPAADKEAAVTASALHAKYAEEIEALYER